MRIIPKTSKVKLTIYKGFTLGDFVIGFIFLTILAITLSSNLPFKWYLSLGLFIIVIPFYINISSERIYLYFVYMFKFLISTKVYIKDSKSLTKDITAVIPYKDIKDNFIVNSDNTYVGVLEIKPLDFRLLSIDKQDEYIDGVFTRLLNGIRDDLEVAIVKLERPLVLDNNLKHELNNVSNLLDSVKNGDMTLEEEKVRLNILEDRIALLDDLNSGEKINYSRYYLSLIGKNKVDLNYDLERMVNILVDGGISSKRLKNEELSIFLNYYMDFYYDERKENIEKDILNIPIKNINFNLVNTKQEKNTLSHFVINNYPLMVPNGWGEGLFDLENTKVVMKLKKVEKYKAIKRIDSAILELESFNRRERASEKIDKGTHLETLQELLMGIERENESIFDTTVVLTVYDEKNKSINKKKVKTKLREMGFSFTEMFGRQYETYISSTLSSVNKLDISRGIQTSTLAACFPFVSNAMMDEKGVLIGENRLPVFMDFFKRDDEYVNSNMVILGKPGSGKSYATKTILTALSSLNCKVFVLDPENEYKKLANSLKGTSLDLASSFCGRINPFEIIQGIEDEENGFYAHLQFLEEFYRLILKGINVDSLELLNKITQELYENMGINSNIDLRKLKSNNYPTFNDLNNLIEKKLLNERDSYMLSCLKVLLNYISKFKTGGRNSNLWTGYTTFSPKENFLVFNFQKLLANKNDSTSNAQMLLVLKWLENEIIKNREKNLKYGLNNKIVVAIDEAHLFIDEKYPIALDFMYQLAKRIRKYDGMLVIITQNIKDFAGTKDIERKSSAIINVSQYSLIFSLSPNDMTELCKLYQNAGEINEVERENIIHNKRGRAFLISSPSRRSNMDVIATKYVENMF